MIDENQKQEFWKVINTLDNLQVLKHLIIIGSWAEYLYYEAKIFEDYRPFIRTQDLDFLIKNKSLPKNKINLVKEFEKIGYNWNSSYNGLEVLRNDVFEIQFMLKEFGKGSLEPIKYEPFNMNLEGLRDLNILSEHTTELLINNKYIFVPKPSIYIIQKMIINHKRKDKKNKDKDSILNLYDYILENKEHHKEFNEIIQSLTRKEKEKVINFCNENYIDINEK